MANEKKHRLVNSGLTRLSERRDSALAPSPSIQTDVLEASSDFQYNSAWRSSSTSSPPTEVGSMMDTSQKTEERTSGTVQTLAMESWTRPVVRPAETLYEQYVRTGRVSWKIVQTPTKSPLERVHEPIPESLVVPTRGLPNPPDLVRRQPDRKPFDPSSNTQCDDCSFWHAKDTPCPSTDIGRMQLRAYNPGHLPPSPRTITQSQIRASTVPWIPKSVEPASKPLELKQLPEIIASLSLKGPETTASDASAYHLSSISVSVNHQPLPLHHSSFMDVTQHGSLAQSSERSTLSSKRSTLQMSSSPSSKPSSLSPEQSTEARPGAQPTCPLEHAPMHPALADPFLGPKVLPDGTYVPRTRWDKHMDAHVKKEDQMRSLSLEERTREQWKSDSVKKQWLLDRPKTWDGPMSERCKWLQQQKAEGKLQIP